jgi:hypothetical protein
MPRNLPALMITAATSNALALCWLLDVQLASGTAHVWTSIGSLNWNGNTYQGVGSFGAVGDISESSDVKAPGTVVQLSGIDPTLLPDCLTDIQQGAPATVWLGLFSAGAIVATYPAFAGTVDKAPIGMGVETATIQLNLETRMTNLQRATNRRYTMADQRLYYSGDIGFSWVEIQNDIALLWG